MSLLAAVLALGPVPEVTPAASVLLGGQPQAVAVAGDRAYVADVDGLSVYALDGLRLLGHASTPGAARDVTLLPDGRVCVADGREGLAIFDVTRPDQPRLSRRIPVPGGARRVRASNRGIAV
ncbi:MAG TPA: hypothetical protein VND93_17695, partial [Myxococcales bacterium]|nr:hypothetical protein [Myxococcales bacterium]